MRILFLDDDPSRHAIFRERLYGHEIVGVETPGQAIDALGGEQFVVASLDHDLFGKIFQPSDEKSGYAVCQFIRAMPGDSKPRLVLCHSYNPDGVMAMMNEIEESMLDALCNAYAVPFGSDEYWNHLPPTTTAISA